MIRTLIGVLTLGIVLATPALARRGNAELKRYCTGDAVTFCGDLDPGSRAMKACFRQHRRQLSRNCRRAIEAYQARGAH